MKIGYFETVKNELAKPLREPTQVQARRAARALASVARGDRDGLRRALQRLGIVPYEEPDADFRAVLAARGCPDCGAKKGHRCHVFRDRIHYSFPAWVGETRNSGNLPVFVHPGRLS